jgi:hypothetical protein
MGILERIDEYVWEVANQEYSEWCAAQGADVSDPDNAFNFCDGNSEFEEWAEDQYGEFWEEVD